MPFSTAARRPLLHTMRTKLSTDEIWLLLRYLEIPVVAISHSQISALPEERRKTIPIIYNSVDFNSYDFSPAMGTHLAFLGRMAPHKGPVQAIEIARKVGLPILLGGAPACGLEASFFAAEVNPLIDGKNIVYIGPVDHAAKCELLRNAAALLFPIQWEEPFGLVMIEAMACGTPVVACRRGSVPEVVESGVTGLYGETADDLVPLVSQAMSFDRSEVRARSKSRFHFIHMVDDYETLYGKLIGSR
jgi:glycosyltransferase involved in cell wall biosynthesis